MLTLPWTLALGLLAPVTEVPQYEVLEVGIESAEAGENPYVTIAATAELRAPGDGVAVRRVPLFWDGGRTWRFRFAADRAGEWTWRVSSMDRGLDGRGGSFQVVESERHGGLRRMEQFPYHFAREDGAPFWFLGDTAWSLFSTNPAEKLDRAAVERHLDTRARQGFNVVHAMLISEGGQGNEGGPAFQDLARERINPAYWQEVDRRVAYANAKGIVVGLVLAWSDKGGNPSNWRDFPSQEARERYARYVAARYGAYDVYFLVGGEWNLEIERSGLGREGLRRQYVAIGDAVAEADAHERLIGIHPGGDGGVEEFHEAARWMGFGDYQQTYANLHASVLAARDHERPVVNSEYAYYLRDQNGDGLTDKPNSADIDSIRHATWDLAMAGGYVVTGFGTTYFGGNREPGPFDVDASKNDDWEAQVQHVRTMFTGLEWWRLEPRDEGIRAEEPRGKDRRVSLSKGDRTERVQAPPERTYWLLADPGRTYVGYMRGVKGAVRIAVREGSYAVRQFDPRTGRGEELGRREAVDGELTYSPPDGQDWVVVARAEVR